MAAWPVALIGAALLLAGCSSPPGTVIAVRAVPQPSQGVLQRDDGALNAILRHLDGELSSASSVPSTHPDKLSPQSQEFLNSLPVLTAERITELTAQGTASIDLRLEALGALSQKLSGLNSLPRAQRTALQNQVLAATRGLTQLRRKILNDTLPDVLRNDVRSITVDYPVLGFLAVDIHLSAACSFLLAAAGDLTAEAARLQPVVAPGDAALLADVLVQAATVSNTANSTLASLIPLTMAGYPGNKATLLAARGAVAAARDAVAKAHDDIAIILSHLG